jgi:hypothetical protein
MAVPPEVMQANSPSPTPGAPPPDAAPGAAPMMSPQKPAGEQEVAKTQMLLVQREMEKSLAAFGSSSPQGKAILDALRIIAKAFGKNEDESAELMPAMLKQALAQESGPGAPPKGAPPPPKPGAAAPPPPGA